MNIKQWLSENKSQEVRDALAEKANTSIGYLSQLAYTPRKAGIEMCKALRDASAEITPDSIIEPRDVRPDIAAIFNDLHDVEGAA
tara:strand:- start:578 stop:832 length:255 start_codon:yes stop_codon:yes gene_type:complete